MAFAWRVKFKFNFFLPSAEVHLRILPVLMVEVYFDIFPYLFQILTFAIIA